MSGFQFPPPPPPPPKTSNADNNLSGQFAPTDRGRGKGRGRGGPDSRGRGGRGRGHPSESRGQYHGSNGRSSSPNLTTPPNTQSPVNSNFGPSGRYPPQHGINSTSVLPPGSYVNPAFHRNPLDTSSNQAAIHANGTQGFPQRTVAGHKRKLEALRGPPQDQQSGPPTAPLIPSFGNPFLPGGKTALPTQALNRQNKSGLNVLGLTPQDDQRHYSSDSDDEAIDEEAMYVELGANLTFEHNGTVTTLNTAADLAAWKDERSKNFPTKQRLAAKVEEKRQIGEERKRLLTEASQALRAARYAEYAKSRAKDASIDEQQVQSKPETQLEKARRELAVQTARLDQLRKSVAKSEAKAARVRDQEAGDKDLVTKMVDCSTPDDKPKGGTIDGQDPKAFRNDTAGSALEDERSDNFEQPTIKAADADDASAKASKTSPTPSVHDDVNGSDDDDGPPEETPSSRQAPTTQLRKVCRYFAASGSCRDGEMCTFKHELDPRAAASLSREQQQRDNHRDRYNADEQHENSPSSKRKTIYDRLLEQEQGQEDRLALQVIRYLGQVGLFAKNEDDTR